jgi:hypothetical protein
MTTRQFLNHQISDLLMNPGSFRHWLETRHIEWFAGTGVGTCPLSEYLSQYTELPIWVAIDFCSFALGQKIEMPQWATDFSRAVANRAYGTIERNECLRLLEEVLTKE